MEYCEEGDLNMYIPKMRERSAPSSLPTRLDIMRQLASALDYLHSQKILHRDLKPANVLVKSSDRGPIIKLADFGIAKEFTSTSRSHTDGVGTLFFMAPEVPHLPSFFLVNPLSFTRQLNPNFSLLPLVSTVLSFILSD